VSAVSDMHRRVDEGKHRLVSMACRRSRPPAFASALLEAQFTVKRGACLYKGPRFPRGIPLLPASHDYPYFEHSLGVTFLSVRDVKLSAAHVRVMRPLPLLLLG
jgi:hypothetical protein